ncbi:PREDICTED: uncharacterized protein LOC104698766 [Camelina sativa]|uniref:Uncharacterized protein LOC104698766 n=1 Tax=Camelina sativa TaxID=90675 RepID=A0ABM0SKH6_CAMSA|nr:PREDICTED: uncharacterized protein LOC104698766 [Camelina sativa]
MPYSFQPPPYSSTPTGNESGLTVLKPLQIQKIQLQLLIGVKFQVGGNTGSGSSGSNRSRESDASDSSSVGSVARPMGRDAAKEKGKKKGKELERLDKITMRQEEANQLMTERTEAKKMKMYLKLSEKEHLDDRSKELLEKLSHDLFGN